MRYTPFVAMLGLAIAGPASTFGQAPGTVRTEVDAAVRAYVDAQNKADAGAVAAMYSTQPGVTSIGDGEIIRGWDRIRESMGVLDSLTAMGARLTVTLGSVDITPLGSGFALAIAPYALTVGAQGGEVRQRGAMTLVFQKIGAEWKIIHDHTSTIPQQSTPGANVAQQLPSQQMRAPAASPGGTSIPIATGAAVEVPAAQILHHDFQIPAGLCTVTGRVLGISGGNKDFEVLILDDDNYRNWSAGLQAKAYGQSGRVTVTNVNAQIPGPGTYHFVVSNTFSVTTPKTVQVWAQAQCP